MDHRNFDPMRHEWWPSIAGMFTTEWTREAAMMDLRWHAVEVRLFARAFPSRPQFMARWRWTERRVRDLLASTAEWQDHAYPMSLADLRGEKVRARSDEGPEKVRPRSDTTRTNADDSPERSDEGPAEVRARSDEGPQARVSPITDHRSPITAGENSSPPADAEVVPPARPKADKPLKADPAPKPDKAPKAPSGAYQLAIDAFDAEYKATFGGVAYPWAFKGRDADGARVKTWLDTARVKAEEPEEGIERIRFAARAYLRAVKAGTAWPLGQPPETRHFTRDLSKWLQISPGRTATRSSGSSLLDQINQSTQRRRDPNAGIADAFEELSRLEGRRPKKKPSIFDTAAELDGLEDGPSLAFSSALSKPTSRPNPNETRRASIAAIDAALEAGRLGDQSFAGFSGTPREPESATLKSIRNLARLAEKHSPSGALNPRGTLASDLVPEDDPDPTTRPGTIDTTWTTS